VVAFQVRCLMFRERLKEHSSSLRIEHRNCPGLFSTSDTKPNRTFVFKVSSVEKAESSLGGGYSIHTQRKVKNLNIQA
jgi:hypothetical protein